MQEKEAMFAWAKTLLCVYKYLKTVTAAIDNLVLKQGLNSGFYHAGGISAFQCANKMIELNDRKRRLINAKILIEDGLAKLPQEDLRLLVLTYVDLLKSTIVSERLGISMRTFFRKKNIAISKFANSLKFLGFTSEKLAEDLKSEEWLLSLYHSYATNLETEENMTKIGEYRLLKYIMKDLNKHIKQYA